MSFIMFVCPNRTHAINQNREIEREGEGSRWCIGEGSRRAHGESAKGAGDIRWRQGGVQKKRASVKRNNVTTRARGAAYARAITPYAAAQHVVARAKVYMRAAWQRK